MNNKAHWNTLENNRKTQDRIPVSSRLYPVPSRVLHWFTRTRRRKIFSTAFMVVLLFAGATIVLLKNKNQSPNICRSQMERLDPKILGLTEFNKTKEAYNTPIAGDHISYTIDNSSSTEKFTLTDSEGNKQTLTLKVPDKPEYDTHTDALRTIFTLNNTDKNEIDIDYEASDGIFLDASTGGYIAVKSLKTGEELMIFKTSQGIDKNSNRIDYKFDIVGNQIVLTPLRDWQFGCTKYPIKVHLPIVASAWDEAMVKVGENCDQPGCEADGDILDIRPSGWNWGVSGKKEGVIVKIPKLTVQEREEYSSRTIRPPDPDDAEDGQEAQVPDYLEARQYEEEGLVRYGIDYTKLASVEQIKEIRNTEKVSPVLSTLDYYKNAKSPKILQDGGPIQKKQDPKLSVIPEKSRLTYNEYKKLRDNQTHKNWLARIISPEAKAAGIVVTSIGTGPGRDYPTLALWESNQNGDLATAHEIHEGVMYKDSEYDLTSEVTIDGSTTNSSYYMHLTVAPSDRHNGKAGSGVIIDGQKNSGDTGGFSCISIQDDYFRIDWQEFKRCSGANSTAGIKIGDSVSSLIQDVIIHDFNSTTSTANGINISVGTGGTTTIRNCIIYNGDQDGGGGIHGDGNNSSGFTATIDNCTVYNMRRNVYEDGGTSATTFNVKNTISMNSVTSNFDIDNGTLSNALCQDNDADCNAGTLSTCTSCLYNKTPSDQFVSLASGNEDFHLKAGSDAINAGTTISGFNNDIDDETRPYSTAWDIGADEYSIKDPVAYYKFDEGADNTCSGGTNDVCDQSTNANDGAISGGVAWKTEDLCVSGKCVWFDGSDDVVTVSNAPSIDFDVGVASASAFMAWVRPNSDGEADVGQIYNKGSNTYLRITNEGADGLADLEASMGLTGSNATATVTDGISLNKWHHVAVTYTDDSDDEITVYIDGIPRAISVDGSGDPADDSNDLLIGGASGANYNGFIDEFKVYNYERTPNEIKTDYVNLAGSRGSSATFGPDNSYLSDGLVGYWKVDENTGTTTYDSSGNGNDSTTWSGATWTTGKYGSAVSFDGNNQVVRFAETNSIDLGNTNQSYTASVWINTSMDVGAGTHAFFFTKRASSSSYPFILYLDESEIVCFEMGDGTNYPVTCNSTALNDGTWHQITGVRDVLNDKLNLYIDGALINSTTDTTTSSLSNNDDVSIGNGGTSYIQKDYAGDMDEARIYNRALTPSEVEGLYHWGPGPLGWWKFDEGTGTSTTYDSSGNGYNGSLTSMTKASWVPGKYGSALEFDGTANYVDLSSHVSNFVGYSTGTITGWFKAGHTAQTNSIMMAITQSGASTDMTFITVGDNTNTYSDESFGIAVKSNNTNELVMRIREGHYAFEDNKWHYFAVVVDGVDNTIYIDGVKKSIFFQVGSATTQYFTNLNSYDKFQIGARQLTSFNYWDGQVDDIRFYNYVRSPSQVIQDMNAGHPAPGSPVDSPVAYWKFDEGNGTTAHDTNTSTGGSEDLTLNTASWTNSGKFGKAWNGTGGAVRMSRSTDSNLEFSDIDSFTLSTWFKSDDTANPGAAEYLIADGGPSGAAGYALYATTNGYICFGIDDDSSWGPDASSCTTTDYYDNTWHNAIGVRDVTADTVSIYIDGVLQDYETDTTSATLDSDSTFFIGDIDTDDAGTGEEFAGDIDETKVYRSAMNTNQVKTEYNQGSAIVWGATSTDSSGNASWSSANEYCPPGQGSTCTAPIGEWKMDENTDSGTGAVKDTSGGGNDGDTNGGMSSANWVPGKFGQALHFDGSDDYINIPEPADDRFDFGSSDSFSVSFWIRTTPKGDTQQPVYKDGAPGWRFRVSNADGSIFFQVRDGSNSDSVEETSVRVDDNVWHYVVGVRDKTSNNIYIYQDGKLLDSHADSTGDLGTGGGNTTDLTFSNDGSGTAVVGDMDNVRVYDYARTPEQIEWEFNHGGPAGWWKFDECSGYNLYDSSGEGNVATASAVPGGDNTSVGTCTSGTTTEMRYNGRTGKRNASLDFDGSDDWAKTGNVALMAFNALTYSNVSWGAWVKPAASPTSDTLVMKGDGSTNNEFRLTTDSSAIPQCEIYSSSWQTAAKATSALTSGNWYHLLCTYDGSNIKLYVNGQLAKTLPQTNSITSSSSTPINIARDPGGGSPTGYFDGQIDDVRVYRYALTQQQVLGVISEGVVRFGPNTGSP